MENIRKLRDAAKALDGVFNLTPKKFLDAMSMAHHFTISMLVTELGKVSPHYIADEKVSKSEHDKLMADDRLPALASISGRLGCTIEEGRQTIEDYIVKLADRVIREHDIY